MAVKIRLRRMGSNKQPFYRMVATDSRSSNTGNFLENLGWYDTKLKGSNYKLQLDRVDYWLGTGAQISDTARSLVKKARKAAAAAPVSAPAATPAA